VGGGEKSMGGEWPATWTAAPGISVFLRIEGSVNFKKVGLSPRELENGGPEVSH